MAIELLFHCSNHSLCAIYNCLLSQPQVSLRGSVVCKEKCGSSVSVALVGLHGTGKEERKKNALIDENSEFMFLNVLPGKYRVEVMFLCFCFNTYSGSLLIYMMNVALSLAHTVITLCHFCGCCLLTLG